MLSWGIQVHSQWQHQGGGTYAPSWRVYPHLPPPPTEEKITKFLDFDDPHKKKKKKKKFWCRHYTQQNSCHGSQMCCDWTVMMWWLFVHLLVALVEGYKTVYLCHLDSYTVTLCTRYLMSSHVVTMQLPTRCLYRFLHRPHGSGYLTTCVSDVVTVQ